jgi:DNA-binding protein HU-beta
VNKQEFIENLAERCDFSKAESGRALNAILESLTDAMVDGEEVNFTGFGKFLSQRRRARQGVNPQDPSQKLRIRAANVPKFKPGAALREAASHAPAGEGTGTGARGARPGKSVDGAAAATTTGEPAASTSSGEPEWRPLGERG